MIPVFHTSHDLKVRTRAYAQSLVTHARACACISESPAQSSPSPLASASRRRCWSYLGGMHLTFVNVAAILMLVAAFGDLWLAQSFPTARHSVKTSVFKKIVLSSKHLRDRDCPSGRSCDGICCPLITDNCCKTAESTSLCCSGSCCGKYGGCCSTGQICCDSQADEALCCDSFSSCCGPICCLYHQTCCGSKCCQAGEICCGSSTCCSSTQQCNGTHCMSTKNHYGPRARQPAVNLDLGHNPETRKKETV